jgi:phenylacetate-CoA ligase
MWGRRAGYDFGTRLYYLRVWTDMNRPSKLGSMLSNIIPLDVANMGKRQFDEIIDEISSYPGECSLIGYASALEELSRSMTAKGVLSLDRAPSSVMAISEALDPALRKTLKEQLGVWPVSRYSNVENGIIAQHLPGGESNFEINHSSFYVELLKMDSDKNAGIGEQGRIVVTDLFNRSMPFIRYDTGDTGVLAITQDGNLRFERIEGRRLDQIFDVNGGRVSSLILTTKMWYYPEIIQYQFVQKSRTRYQFKINMDRPFNREVELAAEFREVLGQGAEIFFTYVNEIPLLSSGKRKKVVNEMTEGTTPN